MRDASAIVAPSVEEVPGYLRAIGLRHGYVAPVAESRVHDFGNGVACFLAAHTIQSLLLRVAAAASRNPPHVAKVACTAVGSNPECTMQS